MCPSVCLSTCPYVHSPICLSVHMPIHPSICLLFHPSVCMSCMYVLYVLPSSICLSVLPSSVSLFFYSCTCFSNCSSFCLSIRLYVLYIQPFNCHSVYSSICLSVHRFVSVSAICLSDYSSICLLVYPSICLSFLSICIFVSAYPQPCLFLFHTSVCSSIHTSVDLSVHRPFSIYICLFISHP